MFSFQNIFWNIVMKALHQGLPDRGDCDGGPLLRVAAPAQHATRGTGGDRPRRRSHFYVWVCISLVVLLNLHLKLRTQTELITTLARKIAIADAQPPKT